MSLLERLEGSGRLLQDEVEVLCLTVRRSEFPSSSLPPGESSSSPTSITLTNFRLLLDYASGGMALSLAKVGSVEGVSSLFSGKSLRIALLPDKRQVIELHCSGNVEAFAAKTQYYLEKKSWLRSAEPVKSLNLQSPVYAGVAGLMRRQERDIQHVSSTQSAALTDMQSLMSSAQEVIRLIEQYSAVLGGQSAEGAAEANELSDILHEIGCVAPVTRLGSTDDVSFFRKVGGQISDLLLQADRIHKMGGIIAATDAYYVYNKARGSPLVSPQDFVKACGYLTSGLALHTYESGVRVIRVSAFGNDSVKDIVDRLIRQLGSVSIVDVAREMKTSALIAKQQLLLEESAGTICRDESYRGLVFYPNIFQRLLMENGT